MVRVGEVSPVPGPRVTLVLEELGLKSRRIGGEHELHRRTSHGDLPFAIALLQSVNVTAADDTRRYPVVVEQAYQDVALAVRRVAVDLAGMRRDVVGVDPDPAAWTGLIQAAYEGPGLMAFPCSSDPSGW